MLGPTTPLAPRLADFLVFPPLNTQTVPRVPAESYRYDLGITVIHPPYSSRSK